MRDIKSQVSKGVVWITASRVIINLAAVASTLTLTRILTPADFGLVAIVNTITTILLGITELSLTQALVQRPKLEEDHFHSAFFLNFLRTALLALVIAVVAFPAAHIYNDDRLIPVFLVIAASTLLTGFMNPKLIVFSRDLDFRQEFALRVAEKVVGLIASLSIALYLRNYWAIVAGTVVSQITVIVVSYVFIPYWPRFRTSHVNDLMSFSIWLTLGQAINVLNWRSDHLAIGYFLGNSPLGLYTVGDNLSSLPTREASLPISQTLFPGFAHIAKDIPRLRSAYARAQSILCMVTFPLGFGLAVVANHLVLLSMGAKWGQIVPIIQILSCTFALQSFSSALQPLAMATGHTKFLFERDVRNLVIRIPFIVLGLIFGGLVGIVWGRCIASFIGTIWNMQLVRQILGTNVIDQFRENTRSVLAILVMCLLGALSNRLMPPLSTTAGLTLSLAITTLTGTISYVGTHIVLWVWQGKPIGPETELLELVAKIMPRMIKGQIAAKRR